MSLHTLASLGGVAAAAAILFLAVATYDAVKGWWNRGNASDSDVDAV